MFRIIMALCTIIALTLAGQYLVGNFQQSMSTHMSHLPE